MRPKIFMIPDPCPRCGHDRIAIANVCPPLLSFYRCESCNLKVESATETDVMRPWGAWRHEKCSMCGMPREAHSETCFVGLGQMHAGKRAIEFLERLADHIAGIDSHCAHCIDGFLKLGEFDDETEEHRGGVNQLLDECFPGLRYEHTRGKHLEPSTVRLVFGAKEDDDEP